MGCACKAAKDIDSLVAGYGSKEGNRWSFKDIMKYMGLVLAASVLSVIFFPFIIIFFIMNGNNPIKIGKMLRREVPSPVKRKRKK